MFPRLAYLEWIEGRPATATHDLGSSDIGSHTRGGVVPPALESAPTPSSDAGLEARIADRYGVDETRVLVTPGATTANLVAVAASLEDGDRVLVERPAYEPLVATPEGLGATVDRYDRREDWSFDPGRLESALEGETALAVTSNRHNPTGARTERATLAQAGEHARERGARLLVDEVYGPYDTTTGRGFGGVTVAGAPGTVATGSLTKFLGLGGLRVGWLVADEAFVERARTVARHLSAVADPSRELGRRAFAAGDRLAARSRDLVAANHDLLASFLAGRDDLSGTVFEDCPYALLFHESADGDAVAAAAWDRELLVVPGRFFGVRDGFRVSLGGEPAAMDAALTALGETLDALGRQG